MEYVRGQRLLHRVLKYVFDNTVHSWTSGGSLIPDIKIQKKFLDNIIQVILIKKIWSKFGFNIGAYL